MKIRSNFVSNSSSSSFIIAGKNIIETLKKFINDNTLCPEDEFYDDMPNMTYGDVNKNLLDQIKESDDEMIKHFIYYSIYNVIEDFRKYAFYKMIPNTVCYCYDWDDVPENMFYDKYDKGKEFDITEEIRKYIQNCMKKYYKKTGKTEEMDYWCIEKYCPKIDEMIKELVEKIFNEFKLKYNEIYVVSYGDNHGKCTGQMGHFVEHTYLGSNLVNNCFNVNWNIYCNSEH